MRKVVVNTGIHKTTYPSIAMGRASQYQAGSRATKQPLLASDMCSEMTQVMDRSGTVISGAVKGRRRRNVRPATCAEVTIKMIASTTAATAESAPRALRVVLNELDGNPRVAGGLPPASSRS